MKRMMNCGLGHFLVLWGDPSFHGYAVQVPATYVQCIAAHLQSLIVGYMYAVVVPGVWSSGSRQSSTVSQT